MIFPKEFEECTIMSPKCPNCGKPTNASSSRLVKDSCGHTKCRKCLLQEEHGCEACQSERCISEKQCAANEDSNKINKASNEENLLPLELVINKDCKSKENRYVSISDRFRSSDLCLENDLTCNDNRKNNDSETISAISDISDKAYIPKIEPNDMILNIQACLKNGNQRNDPATLRNRNNRRREKEHDEETIARSKSAKHRDRSHITIVSNNPERYKCNVCGKIFRNKKGKCYHDACVTGVKPYQCTVCDRSFVKRSHFEYHERVHSGYKPYKCKLCEKAFPQRNKLNRHMFSHSKEKQFICSVCNKRYSKRDDLKNHLNEHSATTTYTCKFCDKPFHILTNLKRHMRTHTNERPHTCDQCKKSFKDKSMLIRHKRIHGKERPFSCAHCNRVFLSKSELRRHLVVHSDEKPFSCEYCQTQFRRKDNLNRHIRHHHSEDSSGGAETKSKESSVVIVVETDRNCSAKNSNQQLRPRQKSKRTQPKSPGKIATSSYVSSHEQINSRLDSMGNITPVITATGEVSNAVPVINGPINIRRLDERSDRKMFPYTEPIPIAQVAVLNRRIEEKLYPQTVISHFVHSYVEDGNSRVNSYPNNNNNNWRLATQEISNSIVTTFSSSKSPLPGTTIDWHNSTTSVCKLKSNRDKGETKEKEDNRIERDNESPIECKKDLVAASSKDEQTNCVSTITKHNFQQLDEDSSENSVSGNKSETMNRVTIPQDFSESCKRKQIDMHWRRRTAETLKPCNS